MIVLFSLLSTSRCHADLEEQNGDNQWLENQPIKSENRKET